MLARASLLLFVCVCVRGSLLAAKEYVCKDPDTGMLYTVNTTWRSSTFCGNYTCKLKRVNPVTAPSRSKIIVNITGPQARSHEDHESNENNQNNRADDFSLTEIAPQSNQNDDRLLSAEEIKKITELLHTVKKSDLQAVIELYNEAKNIYKTMNICENDNDANCKHENDSVEKSRENDSNTKDPTKTIANKVSYWYEPMMNEHRKESDMQTEGSEYLGTTVYPVRNQYEQPYLHPQRNQNYPSYFSGTVFSTNDFGRLGYYNPQANPQNVPSYYQQRDHYSVPNGPYSSCIPCARSYQYQAPLPANTAGIYRPPQDLANNMLRPYQTYNYSTQAYSNYQNYYKGNPWAYYDYYRNYYPTVPAQNSPIATTVSPESNVNSEKDDKSWRTDPLSDAVISEIRANIAERGKLLNIPLKKRIKLERAAKVIKLDQVNNRNKRSISIMDDNDKEKVSIEAGEVHDENIKDSSGAKVELLESFIEKVTCEPTTELGYFRVGNLTQPYPDCCPQKIED